MHRQGTGERALSSGLYNSGHTGTGILCCVEGHLTFSWLPASPLCFDILSQQSRQPVLVIPCDLPFPDAEHA
jgi:hypothetical protein